jgi:membrane peptidoglycan carboxypeptidase
MERKIREALLALHVNNRFTKPQILAMYLNTSYFGNQSYGIDAAAKTYFDKAVDNLNVAEVSLLAGLPQSPLRYNPCMFPGSALARQDVELGLMVDAGYINATQAMAASKEMTGYLHSPAFAALCNANASLKAPHFVDYVRADLEQRFGADMVYKGGLQVYTTYDPQMQALVQEEARKQIDKLKDQHVTNAAVVVERVDDGEIYAMLGSVNFNDATIAGQVNVANRLRQPGSSIKPINYVTAFKYGWTPATRIEDTKTEFPDATGKPYIPINYDERSHGTVTARTALASSLNIPAVKALYFTSTKDPKAPAPLAMIETARNVGITTFNNADGSPKPFGLALTLGGGDVKLLELTGAYSVFARQGAVIPPTPYLKVLDGAGRVLYDLKGKDKPTPRCALFDGEARHEQPDKNGFCAKSAPYAYLITSILSDDRARSIGFGLNGLLKTPYPSAVKTGTTNDFRDNWTMGYTTDWAVGVWVGNDDNSPMIHSTGITGAAPIWRNVLDRIMKGDPGKPFPVPPGIVKEGDEVYVAGKPRIDSADSSQKKIAVDTRNGLLAGPGCPKEFVAEVAVDLSQLALGASSQLPIPKEQSPLCPGGDAAQQTGDVSVADTIATGDDGASVWGRILRANGKPAANVTVAIYGPGDSRVATTSPDGYFNFDELKPNTYRVTTNGAALSVYVPAKRRAIVNFTVP